MRVPRNMTEADVVSTIDKVASTLAHKFKFGYYGVEDIKQEGVVFALQALEKYDEIRPLENFLYSHIRNRLMNLKRDKLRRSDSPCSLCHNSIEGATAHPNGGFCTKYAAWRRRNLSKQNIMTPKDISNISDEKELNTRIESSVVNNAETAEILELIDRRLPVELRSTYLQMRDSVSVPKTRRLEVERAILDILNDNT